MMITQGSSIINRENCSECCEDEADPSFAEEGEMALFDDWCECSRKENKLKRLLKFIEKDGGRDSIKGRLCQTVRSHYDSLDRIADDVQQLGYEGAAVILRERLPRSKTARSGELGEILATELVEEELGFNVPIRRLRYKDGREMALRGDDFIGVGYDKDNKLLLLKGEAKSQSVLTKTTITKARAALSRDNGRCTPSSLLFVADRLLDRNGDDAVLGRAIKNEVGTKTLRPRRIDHVLFTFSANAPPIALKRDLEAADAGRNHTVINVRIEDHQVFIADVYDEVANLGNY